MNPAKPQDVAAANQDSTLASAHGSGSTQAETINQPGVTEPANPPRSSWTDLSDFGYEILGELGRGGMGVVYKARQAGLNRLVALKMVLAGGHSSPDSLARLRAEAATLARFQHPHIVQIHEVGEKDGCPFLALEFVEGGSLDRFLKGAPQPPRAAAAFAETLARALHAAHAHGIVHRDLKPANVLLRISDCGLRIEDSKKPVPQSAANGPALQSAIRNPQSAIENLDQAIPKITDFGLAKHLVGESMHTASHAIMGTPSYMAPEQAQGNSPAVGIPADVYALGAVLYEMLTGRPPFRSTTPLETLRQVLSEEPVAPSRLQPHTPRDLETICLKCLEKDPARRYPNALALADDLKRYLAGEPIQARPLGAGQRLLRWARRRPAVAGLLAALIVVVAASLVSLAWLWRAADQDRARAVQAESDAIRDRGEMERQRNAALTAQGDAEQQRQRAQLYIGYFLNMGSMGRAFDEDPVRRDFNLKVRAKKNNKELTRAALVESAGWFDAETPISLVVEADRPCHLGVWWVDSKGQSTLVFPNREEKDNQAPAGKEMLLLNTPATALTPRLSVQPEFLYVLASAQPWTPEVGTARGPFSAYLGAKDQVRLRDQIDGMMHSKYVLAEEVFLFHVRPAAERELPPPNSKSGKKNGDKGKYKSYNPNLFGD